MGRIYEHVGEATRVFARGNLGAHARRTSPRRDWVLRDMALNYRPRRRSNDWRAPESDASERS